LESVLISLQREIGRAQVPRSDIPPHHMSFFYFYFGKGQKSYCSPRDIAQCSTQCYTVRHSQHRLAAGECGDNFVFFFREKLNQSRAAAAAAAAAATSQPASQPITSCWCKKKMKMKMKRKKKKKKNDTQVRLERLVQECKDIGGTDWRMREYKWNGVQSNDTTNGRSQKSIENSSRSKSLLRMTTRKISKNKRKEEGGI
jgi:hypothetical protein